MPKKATFTQRRLATAPGSPRPGAERTGRKQAAHGGCSEGDPNGGQRQRDPPPARLQTADGESCPGGEEQGNGQATGRRVGRVGFRRRQRAERRIGEDDEHRQQRQQPGEHPTPPDLLGDDAGERGRHQAGHHPRRRQQREQARLALGGEGAGNGDVRHAGKRTGAGALEHSTEHDEGHRGGQRGHDEAGRERDHSRQEGPRRAVAIGLLARRHEADEVGQHVRAEGGAVEPVAPQVCGHGGHGRHDGHRLEGVHRDGHHQPDGQRLGPGWGR